MWLRDATRKEELPQIKDLDKGEFFPYRWGQAVWAYVGGKYGDDLIGQIFRDAVRSGSPLDALKNTTLIEDKELSANWHADIREPVQPDHARHCTCAYVRAFADRERQNADGDKRVAIHQPGRAADRLLLLARSVLHRSLLRGDGDRTNRAEAGRYGAEPAFHEPAVHRIGGIVESGQPPVRGRRRARRKGGAGHSQCLQR